MRRLFAAPVNLVRSRIEHEGFGAEPAPVRGSGFRRIAPSQLQEWMDSEGFATLETMAVAPSLGLDPERVAAVRSDVPAWARLLEVEEYFGRLPSRHDRAAALLVAGRRG